MAPRASTTAHTSRRHPEVVAPGSDSEPHSAHLVKVLGVRDPVLVRGLSHGAIARLLAKSQLQPQHSGVYAVGHAAPIRLARETAALLACGDEAVLSHRSAAMVWRLLAAGRSVEVRWPRVSAPARLA